MQNQGFVDPGQQGNNQNGMWSPSRAEIGEAGLQRTDVPIPPSTPSTHRSRRGQQQQQQQGSIPVQQPSGNLGGYGSQGWPGQSTPLSMPGVAQTQGMTSNVNGNGMTAGLGGFYGSGAAVNVGNLA